MPQATSPDATGRVPDTNDFSTSPVVERLAKNHTCAVLRETIAHQPSTEISLLDAHLFLPREWGIIRVPPVIRPILPTVDEIKAYGVSQDEKLEQADDSLPPSVHETVPAVSAPDSNVYDIEARRFLKDMLHPYGAFATQRDAIMLQMEHVLDCVGDDHEKFIAARRQLEITVQLGEKLLDPLLRESEWEMVAAIEEADKAAKKAKRHLHVVTAEDEDAPEEVSHDEHRFKMRRAILDELALQGKTSVMRNYLAACKTPEAEAEFRANYDRCMQAYRTAEQERQQLSMEPLEPVSEERRKEWAATALEEHTANDLERHRWARGPNHMEAVTYDPNGSFRDKNKAR